MCGEIWMDFHLHFHGELNDMERYKRSIGQGEGVRRALGLCVNQVEYICEGIEINVMISGLEYNGRVHAFIVGYSCDVARH